MSTISPVENDGPVPVDMYGSGRNRKGQVNCSRCGRSVHFDYRYHAVTKCLHDVMIDISQPGKVLAWFSKREVLKKDGI